MADYSIQQGRDVFGGDGEKIGTVGDIFSAYPAGADAGEADTQARDVGADTGMGSDPDNVAQTELEDISVLPATYEQTAAGAYEVGTRQASRIAPITDTPPDEPGGTVRFGPSDTKFFEVHHGGILGMGGNTLYVPMNAIDVIEPDGKVMLRDTADEARRLYAREPRRM